MADTVIPTIMGIVEGQGGSGDPETVIEALLLLGDVIASGGADPEAIEAAVREYLDEHGAQVGYVVTDGDLSITLT